MECGSVVYLHGGWSIAQSLQPQQQQTSQSQPPHQQQDCSPAAFLTSIMLAVTEAAKHKRVNLDVSVKIKVV